MADAHVTRAHEAPEERWGDIVTWRTLISGDRMPTEGLTVGIAEIQPGAPTEGGRHRHDPPEVYYFLSGAATVEIDGSEHLAEAGTAVFIPGGAWHQVTNAGTEPVRLLYAFAVDGFDQVRYERPGSDSNRTVG